MTPEELGKWLSDNVDSIYSFMDYEPTLESEEDLGETLGQWLGNRKWAKGGHRFVHLGIDGAGSQFAAWIRPGSNQIPVVFFGSEGGAGVVATSCKNWAKTIAYAPAVEEYSKSWQTRLDPQSNWMIDGEEVGDDQATKALEALAVYRSATEAKVGKIPALKQLTADIGDIDSEFMKWVASTSGH